MIDKNGNVVVFLAITDYGEDEGEMVISVHDTYDGADKSLCCVGLHASCTFDLRGEIYASKGKTANDYPNGYIRKMKVQQ